jgi:glycosyltransferase involved in cell wall biosynthesis
VLGHIKDVEPVFDACRVTVAPLRYGAGVNGKVAQSLAWGVPAVVTPIAAEGMGLVDGYHAMIASDPADFASKVIRVYNDRTLWEGLSDSGRKHIEASFSYPAARMRLRSMLNKTQP